MTNHLLANTNRKFSACGGPVKTDSALRYADLKAAFELVRRAVAEGRVVPVEVEVGFEVVDDL